MSTLTSPKDSIARWATSLATALYSLRLRNEIDAEMRAFARRMPEYHSVLMGGLLHDLIVTLDPEDPFRNLQFDRSGTVVLHGGDRFGSWRNATDLMPASNADIGRDQSLAPMAEPLTGASVELFFHASSSWQGARDYLLGLSHRAKAGELRQDVFEVAEDAIRWALLRRQAYALDGDSFFSVTAMAWAARTSRIVAGEPVDEGRMLRLRSGSSIPPGTYQELTNPDESETDLPSSDVDGEEEVPESQ